MLRLLDVWGVEFMADSIRGITVKCLDSPVYTVKYRYEFWSMDILSRISG